MRTMNQEKIERLSRFINQYARENNGSSPSLSVIMEYMNMSKSTAYRYVLELEKRGLVSYRGKKTLETELQRKMNCGFRRIPIVGQIVCGTPDEQEEYVSGYLAIPEEWLDGDCFLLRAYGDSMVDIGIEKDDLILVKKSEIAKDGEVVVALTENGNTLKRLFWENGKPRLHAENKKYKPQYRDIYPEMLTIQGIALKVIKNIQ
ncbi:MAG: helix-turn-helix domain-containing protein [Clostridia bacterium]|nr:helix-turn-helix domain-containing protein [Clostridia bacterium]